MTGRPRAIGPYVLHERVGSGAAGAVFRAEDQRLGRTVAVKILASTGERVFVE